MLSRGGYRITLARVITSIHPGRGEGRGWTDMPATFLTWSESVCYACVATWSRDTNFYCDPSVRNDVHGTRAATWTDNGLLVEIVEPLVHRVGRRRRREKSLGGAKMARFLDISGVSYCRVRGSFRTFIRSNFWTRLGSVTRTGKVVGNARDTFTCRGPGYGIDDTPSDAFSRGFRRFGLPFTCHVREHRYEMEWDNNATLGEKKEIVISIWLFFKLNLIHYCIFLFILFIYIFFLFLVVENTVWGDGYLKR